MAKKREKRADRERKRSVVMKSLFCAFFVRVFCRRSRGRGGNTEVEVSFSSCDERLNDSNAQNRFRMAPRRLHRRSERVFHFQRTVERISRGARKEEQEQNHQQQQQQGEEQQKQRVVVVEW